MKATTNANNVFRDTNKVNIKRNKIGKCEEKQITSYLQQFSIIDKYVIGYI